MIVRNELGIALGGIRTPPVDVPVAALSGDAVAGGSPFCFLFGSTTPLSPQVLAELYPTKPDYTAREPGGRSRPDGIAGRLGLLAMTCDCRA